MENKSSNKPAEEVREEAGNSGSGRHAHGHVHKSRPFRRLRHFYRHNKKIFRIVGVLFLIVLLAVSAAVVVNKLSGNGEEEDANHNPSEAYVEAVVEIIPIEGPQNLIGPAAMKLLEEENYSSRAHAMMRFWNTGERLDVPAPVELQFRITVPVGWAVSSIRVLISEDPELTKGRLIDVSPTKRSVTVYNLKADTEYFYRVTVVFVNEEQTEGTGSFKTADTPRLLNIEGIVDVRDIGNRATSSGRKIGQGILFRGMELDAAAQKQNRITEKGIYDLLTVLGVRTDMDMRSPEVDPGFDALGANVTHKYYDILPYKDVFSAYGKSRIKLVFEDLADPDIYPVYLHCSAGTDRTGTICCLLEALLGVNKEDLFTDYELTLLSRRSLQAEAFAEMVDMLEEYEGETLQQKTENYLLECGLTHEQLESIRSIFLG